MNYLSFFGVAICAVFMILCIKEIRREHAFLLSLALGILFVEFLIIQLQDIVNYLQSLSNVLSSRKYVGVLLKALGVAYLTEFSNDVCRSCGEPSIANYVVAIGKIEVLALCLPLIKELTANALKYI